MAVTATPQKMVRVKLTCSRAGHNYDSQGRACGTFSQAPGDIVEMPEDEAKRNIDGGIASLVPAETK